ncbi:MAG: hypothetical protein ACO1SX_12055 [Actinomycetota bacterium]
MSDTNRGARSDGNWHLRYLFVLAALSGPFCFFVAHYWQEPYPWLIMPGFLGDCRNASGQLAGGTMEAHIEFVDGSRQVVRIRELLGEAPSSITPRIAGNIFDPPTPLTEVEARTQPGADAKGWVKRHVIPGLLAYQRNRLRATPDPQTVAWLQQRLVKLYPSYRVKRVAFVGYRETYARIEGKWRRTRIEAGRNEIEVDHAGHP